MVDETSLDNSEEFDAALSAAMRDDERQPLQDNLQPLSAAEIARLLESVPPARRAELWQSADAEHRGEILTHLSSGVLELLAESVDPASILESVDGLPEADLALIAEYLPRKVTESMIAALDNDYRQRLETMLSFDEDSIMRLLDHDVITVRRSGTVASVLEFLRRRKGPPAGTDQLFVIDRQKKLIGTVFMHELLGAPLSTTMSQLLHGDIDRIHADDDREVVARLFEDEDLLSAPVVDENERVLGRIRIDDMMDVVHEAAERTGLQMAGVDGEDDLFSPVFRSAKTRALWLGLNLLTALLASSVIGMFTEALEKIVVLAVLMPVVASMGGIAGSQTLTLVIRGMALGQVSAANTVWLARKEVAVAMLNGVLWAIVIGLVVLLWFKDPGVAGIIAIAIVINLFAAAVAGIAIPLILDKLKLDPALSGAVILTTVTDVVGFMSFLGLSTALLL